MNNRTTMERFSRTAQGEDSTIKILNSGIRNDDRIIVDSYRTIGSFAGSYKEDIELERRLLTNELHELNSRKALEEVDSFALNKKIVDKYQRSSGVELVAMNCFAMCTQTEMKPQQEILDGRIRHYKSKELIAT